MERERRNNKIMHLPKLIVILPISFKMLGNKINLKAIFNHNVTVLHSCYIYTNETTNRRSKDDNF